MCELSKAKLLWETSILLNSCARVCTRVRVCASLFNKTTALVVIVRDDEDVRADEMEKTLSRETLCLAQGWTNHKRGAEFERFSGFRKIKK